MSNTPLTSKLAKILAIARPYGIRKLLLTLGFSLVQGLLQVIGVGSIFPFLALAANPSGFRSTRVGQMIEAQLPGWTDAQLLMLSGCFAIFMLVVSNVALLLGEIVRGHFAQGLGHWLRTKMLARIVSNNYSYFLQRNSGELLKKSIGDVMGFTNGMLSPLLDLIARIMVVLLLLGLLLYVHFWLTLAAGAVLGSIYVAVYFLLRKRRQMTSDGLKEANRGAMKQAVQVLSGIKAIKIHAAEEYFLDRYKAYSGRQANLSRWIPVMSNLPRYIVEPIAFGGIILVVLIFLRHGEPLEGILPILGVMAFAGYRLLPNLQLLFNSMSQMSIASHTLEEIDVEFDDQSRRAVAVQARSIGLGQSIAWEQELELREVEFQYPGTEAPTLRGINLKIPKYKFYAFVGETGSGKSTLIDLILGLHRPSSGKMLLDGEEITTDNLSAWQSRIGYVPQDLFLSDDTIAANIAFGERPEDFDWARIREVTAAAQIANFVEEELPAKYGTLVGERGVRLSGGQKQRLGLARALYRRPELLVLDEATSALDEATEAALIAAIESLHGRLTLIVIAHRLSTIRRADQVIRLASGRVAQVGTFAEVVGNA